MLKSMRTRTAGDLTLVYYKRYIFRSIITGVDIE